VLAIIRNTIPSDPGRRATRLLTAVVVAGLCVFAVVHGWRIITFTVARAHLGADPQAVKAWVAAPGLAGAAREASLTAVTDPSDVAAARMRAEDLAAVLSVWPLSARNWLSLAGVWLVTGQPYEQVLGAMAMSSVTGPNEGSLMLQRGIFGVLQWEVLPATARKRVITDLAGIVMGTPVQDVETNSARAVLTSKPAATQREIADLLRAEGVPARELARMGL
jgi:hypothetical protein